MTKPERGDRRAPGLDARDGAEPVRTRTVEFGSPDFPIAEVLGPRTRGVLMAADRGDAFIIERRSSGNLATARILAGGRPLGEKQIRSIRDAVLNPMAYYNGRPIFKRLPPGQDFAIQLHAGAKSMDLMIDLMNASWGFYCEGESYQDWNWVGHVFREIAKESFPELASPSRKAMWRRGVIHELSRRT